MAVMLLPSRDGDAGFQLSPSSAVRHTRKVPVKTTSESLGSMAMKTIHIRFRSGLVRGSGETSTQRGSAGRKRMMRMRWDEA